jgi:hypothetical protein
MSDSALVQEIVDLRKQVRKLEEENKKLKAWIKICVLPENRPASLDPVSDPPVDLPAPSK